MFQVMTGVICMQCIYGFFSLCGCSDARVLTVVRKSELVAVCCRGG